MNEAGTIDTYILPALKAAGWPWSSAGVPGIATLQRGGRERRDSGETR